LLHILLLMHVCLCCVWFSFSVLSQEIGYEERLWNDLFCVGWDVKRWLSHWISRVCALLGTAASVIVAVMVVSLSLTSQRRVLLAHTVALALTVDIMSTVCGYWQCPVTLMTWLQWVMSLGRRH